MKRVRLKREVTSRRAKRRANNRGPAKGARFERDMCRLFSLWITGGARDDVFWRSAMSGGSATVSAALRKAQEGDLSAIDPAGHALLTHFVLELKNWKDLKWRDLVLGKRRLNGVVDHFIKCRAKVRSGRELMLVAKDNRNKPVLVLDESGACVLLELCTAADVEYCEPLCTSHTHQLHVYDLDQFMARISSEVFG